MSLKYGCDPEFFISYSQDVEGHDSSLNFVAPPAYLEDTFGLTRIVDDEKHPVYIKGDNYNFVGDGVAMELNTNSPFENPMDMYDTVQKALRNLTEVVDTLNTNGGDFSVGCHPVINFDYKRWWVPEHMQDPRFTSSVIFGCDKDYDAFDIAWESKTLDVPTHPLRYGGGHIHMSGSKYFETHPIPAVQLMAIYVGTYCLVNSPFLAQEKLRAEYYGKPGKYRIQRYKDGTAGIEYRTPSNAWTYMSPEVFQGIFVQIEKAVSVLSDRRKVKKVIAEYATNAAVAIKTVDVDFCNYILGSA